MWNKGTCYKIFLFQTIFVPNLRDQRSKSKIHSHSQVKTWCQQDLLPPDVMVSPLTYVKKGWLMFEANSVFRFRCLECVDILCLECVNILCLECVDILCLECVNILYSDCDDSKLDNLTPVILYFMSWSADYLYFRSWSADCLYFQSWSADYLQPLLQVMYSWLSLTSIWSWLAAYLCSWILGLDSVIWHTWHTWCTMT